MLRFSISNKLNAFKKQVNIYNSLMRAVSNLHELTEFEEELTELPISAVKDDLNKLMVRGKAFYKLGVSDHLFFAKAMDSFARVFESPKASLGEKIEAYTNCAKICELRKDKKHEEQYLKQIDDMLIDLDKSGKQISLPPLALRDIIMRLTENDNYSFNLNKNANSLKA